MAPPTPSRRYRWIAAFALLCAFSVSWLSEDPEEVGLSERSQVRLRALSTHLRKLAAPTSEGTKSPRAGTVPSPQIPLLRADAGGVSFEICGRVEQAAVRRPKIRYLRSVQGRSPPVVSL
jgi:hypothetical protein